MAVSRTPVESQKTLPHLTIPRFALHEQPFADDRDRVLFYHAQRFVSNNLADALDPSDVWLRYVMPMSHAAMPLKHALCALGAAHQHFLLSGPGTSLASSKSPLQTEATAIKKYNDAIAQIRAHVANSAGDVDTDLIIMCCLTFACLENLLGRHEQSTQHLRAGVCLLTASFPSKRSQERRLLGDNLFRVFYWLGLDIYMYTCSDHGICEGVLPHIVPPDMGSPYEPFADHNEARETLQGLDIIYDATLLSSGGLHMAYSFEHPPTNPVAAGQLLSDERAALSTTREAFNIWSQRLDLYRASTQRSSSKSCNSRQDALLYLDQAIWASLVKLGTFDDPLPIEDLKEIMARAEQVILTWEQQDSPTFSFEGNIIPVLALLCASCGDRDIRLQIVARLRSLRRREGLWDSEKVADACEAQLLVGSPASARTLLPKGLQREWR